MHLAIDLEPGRLLAQQQPHTSMARLLLDLSINETLSRTVVTSLSIGITLAILLVLGPDVIFGFSSVRWALTSVPSRRIRCRRVATAPCGQERLRRSIPSSHPNRRERG